MSEECTHNCDSCSLDCESKKTDFRAHLNEHSSVKKVIAVMSGKGGVGKSLITSLLAVNSMRAGYHTAVLDADITGPSIPKAFGVKEKAFANQYGILPLQSHTGIELMSINFLLENDTDPVVWRGPIIAGTVKQFWTDVVWDDTEFLFIDMPPGTGDVPLTVFQSIPLDGIVIVTTPQDLVSMIVKKAVNMAALMNIPVIGLVENMSYVTCPDCGKVINVFGESKAEAVAKECEIPFLGRLPIDPKLAALCDRGIIELMENDYMDGIADSVEAFVAKK